MCFTNSDKKWIGWLLFSRKVFEWATIPVRLILYLCCTYTRAHIYSETLIAQIIGSISPLPATMTRNAELQC